MTAAEISEYIAELKSRGSRPGLSAVSALAEKMGDPQKGLCAVHIAGTNGKGSVLAYLTSVLKAAGISCGCFYSPAMNDERETVCVGGRPVSQKNWNAYWEKIKAAEAALDAEGKELPTFFEALTVLAFAYFKDKGCEAVVVECGMGGAEDATNILTDTKVCVFAPIALDHMGFLGNTIEAIAETKSGIIKAGACVVSAQQKPEVTRILSEKAEKAGCSFVQAQLPDKIHYSLSGIRFNLKPYGSIKLGLAGAYQPANAALAIKAAEALRDKGFKISDKALKEGLKAAQWYGRFSLLDKDPYLIADGAHNEAGAQALKESLDIYFPEGGYILMMGVLRDKEYEKIISILSGGASHLVTLTPPGNPRALDGYELAECGAGYIPNTTAAGSVEEALEMALLLSGGERPVIACGSLSWLYALRIAAENRRKLKKKDQKDGR